MRNWEVIKGNVFDEVVYRHVHSSGLEILLAPKKDFTRTYSYFGTRYGSFHNCFTLNGEMRCMPLGIAHFLEHKIFEDPEKGPFEIFAGLGASVNAYTSYNSTVYHFSTVDNFDTCMRELLKFVQRVRLTDENVEKEKGIIVQELKTYEDEPDYQVYFNLINSLYQVHPLKYDIGGDPENVNRTTREELQACYDAFYAPANMFVLSTVDMDPDDFADLVEAELTEEYLSRVTAVKEPLPEEPYEVARESITIDANVAMPLFEFGVKGHLNFDSNSALYDTIMSLKILLDIHFGKSSAFYTKLYDQGLINNTFGIDFTFGDAYAHYNFGGESNHPEAVVAHIKEEVARIVAEGTDQVAFDRIKRKLLGRTITSANSAQYIASAYMNYMLKGVALFDYFEAMGYTSPQSGIQYLKETLVPNRTSLVIARAGGQTE